MRVNHTPDKGKTENPILVYSRNHFAQMMGHLGRQPMVALDTESDSLYRYYPKVCLIQLTTSADDAGDNPLAVVDYLVDPLRSEEVPTLAVLLADPAIEKVIHAAENDMLVLQRAYGFTFQNIFDTQLAARILGWKRLGLASILEENFGVISDKRMQRTDWGKRPLTPQQIAYAQMDTHYLLALRQRLADELHERGRWEEAKEAFEQLSRLQYTPREESTRTFWQMKGVRDLPREHTGVLAALWQWREHEAQRRDRPPFKILNDEALLTLASQRPTERQGLRRIRGLSDQQIANYGQVLLRTIASGAEQPLPRLPAHTARGDHLPDAATQRRFDALRQWRSEVAAKRDVTPDIILTNETLMEIAQRQPQSEADLLQIDAIGPWKAATYGPAILSRLRRT